VNELQALTLTVCRCLRSSRAHLRYQRYPRTRSTMRWLSEAEARSEMFTEVAKDGKARSIHQAGGQWKIVSAQFSAMPQRL
jgi:hypothetical protein